MWQATQQQKQQRQKILKTNWQSRVYTVRFQDKSDCQPTLCIILTHKHHAVLTTCKLKSRLWQNSLAFPPKAVQKLLRWKFDLLSDFSAQIVTNSYKNAFAISVTHKQHCQASKHNQQLNNNKYSVATGGLQVGLLLLFLKITLGDFCLY